MKTFYLAIMERKGRECRASDIIAQIGRWNLLAVSGGRWGKIHDSETIPSENGTAFRSYEIGVWIPCGTNRMVEVILDWDDTYIVRRVRRISRGAAKHTGVVEFEQREVYCDQVSEVVYQASLWRMP